MRDIVFLRHGITSWNQEGRIQGRRDVELCSTGRAELQRQCLPTRWHNAEWHVSPLARTRESAALLGARSPVIDERLQEMDWGEWEGARLAELRAAFGEEMARNEARGLDFRPPGGESPREVRDRLRLWLNGMTTTGAPIVAMTHKGVIRAALSLAANWDMKSDFQPHPEWGSAHVFKRHASGTLALDHLNVSLEPAHE